MLISTLLPQKRGIGSGGIVSIVEKREAGTNWLPDFVFYWTIGFGNWTLGSTMIGIGLNWWQSILTIFLSQLISSIAVCQSSIMETSLWKQTLNSLDGIQLKMCQCIPHWISYRRTKRIWDVGSILFCWRQSTFSDCMVRCTTLFRRSVSEQARRGTES